MARNEAKRIFDLVDCIQGTYVDTITDGVTADNPDCENPCKVEYHPDQPAFKGIRTMASFFLGRGSSVVTNRVYPKEAISHYTLENHSEEGVPERVVVIEEDQHGNQTWLDQVHESFDKSIARMSEQLSRARKGQMETEIDKMENEEQSRQQNEPSGGSRRSRNDNAQSLEDLF